MGSRACLRLPRRRHQRSAGGLGPRRRQPPLHPGPPRGDGSLRSGRLRQVLRQGRRVRRHLRARRHPPPQRAVRRQARPRARRRDRRADQPQRDGRLLPARDRPGEPVQGRGLRLLRDGHRPGAAAQRAGQGHAHRHGPPVGHGCDHPRRRAGTGLLAARARLQDGPLQPRHAPVRAGAERRGPHPGRRGAQRGRKGRDPGRTGRPRGAPGGHGARRPARCRGGEGAAGQGCPRRRPAVRHRFHRSVGHKAVVRVDDGLRHPPGHRVLLPLHPVPARVRPGSGGADRHRPAHGRYALPVRGQPGRRRPPDAEPAATAARRGQGQRVAQEDREEHLPLVGGHAATRRGRRRPGQPRVRHSRAQRPAAGERDPVVRLRLGRQLVRPTSEAARRHARLAVRHARHHGARRALRHRGEVRARRPSGHRARRGRGDADERHGRAHHHRQVLPGVGGPQADRGRPQQPGPQPGHLGDARHGGRPPVRGLAVAARLPLRRLRPHGRSGRAARREAAGRPGRLGDGPGRRPALCARLRDRPGRPADPPHATLDQIEAAATSILKGDSDRAGMVRQGFKAKVQEFLPGHRNRETRPGTQDGT